MSGSVLTCFPNTRKLSIKPFLNHHIRRLTDSNKETNMRVHIQIWPLLVAATAGASPSLTQHKALSNTTTTTTAVPRVVTHSPLSSSSALPPSLVAEASTVKLANFDTRSQSRGAAQDVSTQDTADTSVVATESPRAKTEEPAASLQIAFLVLGALLALASVVVAVFFGYKQLSFMRVQSSIDRNDVRDDGRGGVDLEMGAVVLPDDSSDPVETATDSAHPSVQPS